MKVSLFLHLLFSDYLSKMRFVCVLLLGLSFIFNSGCKSSTELVVSDITSVYFEIDERETINHGVEFRAEIIAVHKDGREVPITNNKIAEVRSSILERINPSTFIIGNNPTSFSDTNYLIEFYVNDGSEQFIGYDSLNLNYKNSINVLNTSNEGATGTNGVNGGNTLFGRNGGKGRAGAHGNNGEHGDNYTVHIWNEGSETRLILEDDSTGIKWKYRCQSCNSISIDLSGANGGNGGDGGNGGNGKPGKTPDKLPGDGGDGGDGGNAGDGGNGGSVIVFLHPNAQEMKKKITILNSGGNPGMIGIPGKGGMSGKAQKGQERARTGEVGRVGEKGQRGQDGPKPIFSVIAFDFYN